MEARWVGIEVSCDDSIADALASEVALAFHVGVEIGHGCVRFYVEGDELLMEWELKLRRLLEDATDALSLDTPLSFVTFPLHDEGWADRWKIHFKPLRIGKHFIICPTWEEVSPGPGDLIIVMDPGRAFGTGHHETTRLCLEWLETWGESGDRSRCSFLDVGTGSGILAVAAALTGFGQVLGVDNDPEAIEVAQENVTLNGLQDRVELMEGTAAEAPASFDVVTANIQALPLIEMARSLAERVKGSGRLVLSGILIEQQNDVCNAYERNGFRSLQRESAGEWVLLVFEKEGKGD